MTRALLTGSTGLIGSKVLSYLLDNTDWQITCITSSSDGLDKIMDSNDIKEVERVQDQEYALYRKGRISIVIHDLTNALPDIGTFNYIVHLASFSSIPESIKEPVPFILNNVQVTLNMLEYARQHPPKMFINFSTTGIYTGQTVPKAILEDVGNNWGSLLPTSPYIGSKVAQEAIAYSYYHTYRLPIVIVSSSNAIGPGQAPNNFVPKIIDLIKSGKEIPIYTSNGEIGSRVYNPVANIADALLFILQHVTPNMDHDRPDTFSLSGGQRLSNLGMAQVVANLLGKELHYNLVEADTFLPGYDAHYDYSDTKLEKLGWKPKQGLKDGLMEIIKG